MDYDALCEAIDEYQDEHLGPGEYGWKKPPAWELVPKMAHRTFMDLAKGAQLRCHAYSADELWGKAPGFPTDQFVSIPSQQYFWLVRDARLYFVNTEGYRHPRYILEVTHD